MGARVYPGSAKEIGFAPVLLTEAGQASPLAPLAEGQHVLHWHGDTFDLPYGTQLLASTESYTNQAFSVDANILGLQFHLEAGSENESWLTGHAAEVEASEIDPDSVRTDADRAAAHLEKMSGDILLNWLSGAGLHGEAAP